MRKKVKCTSCKGGKRRIPSELRLGWRVPCQLLAVVKFSRVLVVMHKFPLLHPRTLNGGVKICILCILYCTRININL